jgi:hypothetical protein
MTLRPLLDLLLPEFAPALIGNNARAALESAVVAMAPIPRVAIECRLASDNAQVDIQQQLRRHAGEGQILRRHLEKYGGSSRMMKLSRFCDAWVSGGNALARIDEVFLEYDVRTDEREVEVPGVFFALPREDGWEVAREAISLFHDEHPFDGPAGAIRSCFEAAKNSGGAWIGYIGLLLNREGDPTRLNVKGMRPRSLRTFLKDIGWDGDSDEADAWFDWAVDRVDRVTLALDLSGAAVLPRLGLECILNRQPAVEKRWSKLLDALVHQGLCDGDKRRAALAVPGITLPTLAGKPWLPQWIARSLMSPTGHFSALDRALYHIKLTLEPDGSRKAKAYFGAQDVWLVHKGGQVRGAPSVASAVVTDSALDPSLEAMMERAKAVLLERQGQNGLWRDFLLFNDESNEWVSAFVATALVEAGGRRVFGAAADAMSRLATQQRPDGGWGYDDASEPDADSTAWVLRFHADIGGLGEEAAARAIAFLRSHAKSGGIATYRESADLTTFAGVMPGSPEEGWKQAHCCVTAAAAPFLDWNVLPYLAVQQSPEGCWKSYWWYNDAYPTALCAEALATSASYALNVDAVCVWATREAAHPELNDFDAAWCLRILVLCPEDAAIRRTARQIVERLRERQLPDGRWRTGALARFPMPDILAPEAGDRITPFQDQHGLFTTAAVLAALARWKGYNHEP